MKLDRNTTEGEQGKYQLFMNRRLQEMRRGTFGTLPPDIAAAIKLLKDNGVIDDSHVGSEGEYFVIRLRDKYAGPALAAYALAAIPDDEEYAREIMDMVDRAGTNSPFCKRPD